MMETETVQITRAMRFAAAERQWMLERDMGAGVADAGDMIEATAIRHARYWESFAECYAGELGQAGRALLAVFTAGDVVEWVGLYRSAEYRQLVQRCFDLAQAQR